MSHKGLGWLFASVMIAVCSGIAHGATIRRLNPSTPLTSPATITVDVGSRLSVLCTEPGGTVQWYGPDGEPIVSGDGVQVGGTTSVQVLTFTSYQSSQGGQYECRSSKDDIKDTQIVRFVSPEPTTESTGLTEKATTRESTTPTTTPPPKLRVPLKVGPPALTKAVRSGRPALTVTWTAPQSDRPITKYQVQYRRTGTTSWSTRDVRTRSVTLENLSHGTSYQVQVRAVSDVGNGPFSDVRTLSTCRVPQKVGPPVLTKTARSGRPALTVTWTVPQSDCPITKYQVQYRRTGTTSWSTRDVRTRSVTLENLFPGTSYQVQVRAVSGVGSGPFSDVRTLSTYRVPQKMGPPILTKAVRSGRPALTVTWTAPRSDRPVTKYQVQYRRTGTTSWSTRDVRTRSVTLENLSPGTSYQVQVRAVSDVGSGSFSDMRTLLTYRVPEKVGPPALAKTLRSGRPALTVTWTAPQSERPITKYQVQYRRTSTTSWTTNDVRTRSVILENLPLGTSYKVQVRAVSDVGSGPFSDMRTNSTYRIPQQVAGVNSTDVTKGNSLNLTTTWIRPSSELPITHYEVEYKEDNVVQPIVTADDEFVVIRGTVGRTYSVRVRAVSAVGTGPWSKTDKPPESPSNIKVVNYLTSFTINWDKMPQVKYRVYIRQWKSNKGIIFTPVLPPYNITGLESNTRYHIAVEAYNSLGGNNGSTTSAIIPQVPGSLKLQVLSSTAIKVSWTPPPNADRLPLTYHVSYSSEFTSSTSKSTREQSLNLTGLHAFDVYTVTVEAVNSGGRSTAVSTNARTFMSAPMLAPKSLRHVNKTSKSVLLQWSIPPRINRNGIIFQYAIRVYVTESTPQGRRVRSVGNYTVNIDNPTFDEPTTSQYTLTTLTPHTHYSWRVAAVNEAGKGPFSALNSFWTKQDVPGPVSNLFYIITSNTSARITWSEPTEPNGVITGYVMEYGVYGGSKTTVNFREDVTTKLLNNLTPMRPVEVTVSARTIIGVGQDASEIFFTSEGTPTVAVRNVVINWINDNSAVRVSWTPLTLHEARGFPLYVVTYYPSSLGRVSRDTNRITTTDSSVVIGGLDPTTSYSFMVDVYTGNATIRGNATAVAHVSAALPQPAVVVGAAVAVLLIAVIITVVVVLLVILCRRMRKSPDSFKPLKWKKNKRDATEEDEVEMASLETDKSITDFSVPILKSTFSEHVAALHAGEDKGFEAEYDTITNDPNGLDDIAKTHRHKNRYLNIYTYNHSRVALSVCDDKGSDYINASYIDGYKAASMYIASQGATQSTRADFIQMILDHKTPVVVMLTKLVENGKPKCERYWNDEVNTPLELSDYLTVTTTACRSYSGYEMRTLSITNTRDAADTPHVVKHFYYTAWPDHGVPECPSSIVKFIQHVRRHYGSSYAPLVVHCSAGVGRTGTFITIDAMMQRLKAKDDLNIYEYVSYMRTRRTFMVQNQDQYSFVHDALVDYIRCGETVFAPHELRLAITELEAVDSDAKDSGFQRQFKVLEESSKSPSSDDEDTFKKPGMVKKNRYKNKHPYSSGYPHLPGKTGGAGADYYNASFIDGFQGKRAFIAAQSPLPNTRNDFWEVVWFFKTPTIVLLCNFKEGDQESCSKFWPDKQLHSMEFGSLSVTFKDAHELDGYDMVTLEVKDNKRETRPSHPVTLFHYKEWSLGDKPQIDSLLAMMGQVEKCQTGKGKPPIIMCDDGMGRTGVFIGTMSEIERVKLEGEVDIFNTIKCLRNNRPHMVCTVNQYELCFELLQAYLDSFDTYANFKVV